jgi:hypothetical protein
MINVFNKKTVRLSPCHIRCIHRLMNSSSPSAEIIGSGILISVPRLRLMRLIWKERNFDFFRTWNEDQADVSDDGEVSDDEDVDDDDVGNVGDDVIHSSTIVMGFLFCSLGTEIRSTNFNQLIVENIINKGLFDLTQKWIQTFDYQWQWQPTQTFNPKMDTNIWLSMTVAAHPNIYILTGWSSRHKTKCHFCLPHIVPCQHWVSKVGNKKRNSNFKSSIFKNFLSMRLYR